MVNIRSQNFVAAEFVLEAFAGLVGVSSAISLETFICNIFTCKQLRVRCAETTPTQLCSLPFLLRMLNKTKRTANQNRPSN